jgi:Leucine-rich repeat (LRR) protein
MPTTICGKEYDNPKEVKHLRLSSMGLQTLNGDELLQFRNVEVLDLYENRFMTLPDEINHLTELRILRIYNNRLVTMPDLSNLTKLEELNVTNNYLTIIHPSVFTLPRMVNLYIGGNYISPDTYLATRFKIFCDSYKTSDFVDSQPEPGSMNMERSGVTAELMRINRINANKNPDEPTTFDQYDNFISENTEITKKTYQFMYELIARSATLIIESNNLARRNMALLREAGVDAVYDADRNDKILRQLNDYMFDLTDQASLNFEATQKETTKFINQMQGDYARMQLKLSNLELTNERLVGYNKKLKETITPEANNKAKKLTKGQQKNVALREIDSLKTQLNAMKYNDQHKTHQLHNLNDSIRRLKMEKRELQEQIEDLETAIRFR